MCMSIYPLMKVTKDGKVKQPIHSYMTEEAVRSQYAFWLTNELNSQYRLHSTNWHDWDSAFSYDLKCPKCGNTLTLRGMPLNHYDLGLYVCEHCKKN